MIGRLKVFSSQRLKVILVILVVVGIAAGFWYLWRIRVGEVQLSAKTELCQNTSQLGAIYGSNQWAIGAQLTTINFKGHEAGFHKLAAPWLLKVAKEIKEEKINYSFDQIETFNWRVKTDGYGQSLHSYGVAIDINAPRNPYSFSGQLVSDLPKGMINIFKKHGFYWGGDWKNFCDPMHFEWYGAQIKGKILDKNTKDLVGSSTVYVDGERLAAIKGNFSFAIPEGKHLVTIKNSRYQDYKFKIKISCNQIIEKNIFIKPVPLGTPAVIKGKVIIAKESPLELPADIYIDGVYATKADVDGDYTISNVPGGVTHLIEARVIPIFIGSTRVAVEPGKLIRDVNIKMTPGLNR